MLQSFSQPVPPRGGGDERMTRMIGAVPWGEMMMVVVVLGRGVIIITGPPCQSGSGNLWVSGWEGGVPSGAQNLPRTSDRQREDLLHCQHSPWDDEEGGTMEQIQYPHLHASLYNLYCVYAVC